MFFSNSPVAVISLTFLLQVLLFKQMFPYKIVYLFVLWQLFWKCFVYWQRSPRYTYKYKKNPFFSHTYQRSRRQRQYRNSCHLSWWPYWISGRDVSTERRLHVSHVLSIHWCRFQTRTKKCQNRLSLGQIKWFHQLKWKSMCNEIDRSHLDMKFYVQCFGFWDSFTVLVHRGCI